VKQIDRSVIKKPAEGRVLDQMLVLTNRNDFGASWRRSVYRVGKLDWLSAQGSGHKPPDEPLEPCDKLEYGLEQVLV
jgi:hypothetical protein